MKISQSEFLEETEISLPCLQLYVKKTSLCSWFFRNKICICYFIWKQPAFTLAMLALINWLFFSISVIVYILTSQNAIWNCWVFSLSTYILTATNKYYTISWSCFLTHVTFLHSFDLFTACILRKLSLYRKIIWKISKISCNSVALHRHNPLWVEKCVLLEIGGIQEHRPSPSSSYLHRFFQSYSRAILTSL